MEKIFSFLPRTFWPLWSIFMVITWALNGLQNIIFFGLGDLTWYLSLERASYAPPGGVIGLVWALLFALMNIGLAYEYLRTSKLSLMTLKILRLYLIYFLFLPLYMGFQSVWLGLAWVILSLFFTWQLLFFFWQEKNENGWYFFPSGLWLLFALYLSYNAAILNAPL